MAGPISLATTFGISVDFFSSGYLDVSVLRVCFWLLRWPLLAGFPHSDIVGSMLICQLPYAFRKLLRPSSPVIAKASTTCTYSLDSIILEVFLPLQVKIFLRFNDLFFSFFSSWLTTRRSELCIICLLQLLTQVFNLSFLFALKLNNRQSCFTT